MVKIINGEIVADDDPRLRQRQASQPGPPESAPRGGRGEGSGPYGQGGQAARPGAQVDAAGGAAAAARAGGIGFNLSAPPLQFVPPQPGSDTLGLPDVEVFGVRITPFAILGVVGLGMMLGWRGVLVALVLYYVYLANQGTNQQPAAQQQQQQQGAAGPQGQPPAAGGNPMDFLQNYLNGPRPPPSAQRGSHTGQGAAGPRHQQPYGVGTGAGQGQGQAQDPSAAAGGGAGRGSSGGWAAFQGQGQKLGKS
ncbi:hypothetical protein HYH02_006395 [Chlamydomonas schloesseri]|uniref:DUF4605 domain-containing protein n=1 Tax=Chlamydomonas schloesseri TaxID=2026947 RepID=A0A835WJR0_9CHLO|nr:hypothetical protein HYH02_006395 [Chlamydomonas schloesseri]|eukprot:KAG2448504.1 hypothetical protein HYH02_006395 [Chlamydomonas schloesseri]